MDDLTVRLAKALAQAIDNWEYRFDDETSDAALEEAKNTLKEYDAQLPSADDVRGVLADRSYHDSGCTRNHQGGDCFP